MEIKQLTDEIAALPEVRLYGRVSGVLGLLVEVSGIERQVSLGSRIVIEARDGRKVPAELVGFKHGRSLVMPFGMLDGIGLGCKAEAQAAQPVITPSNGWLGRIVNALGEPIDGLGALPAGDSPVVVKGNPPPAQTRQRVSGKLDLGIRALNTFVTCCRGQRLGIFSGSGVGKSVLMSMIAKYTAADVTVIGLVGERGRELQEFIEDDLGVEGRKRAVVVVATSDEPPLMRRQAAYMTLAIAEYFRAQGQQVLCLIDSVTRFAMAQREIGLSAGEPPTTKGYPPSVFAELPRLLERAGPGIVGQGAMTGLFTVLVEGDDHNEPIADAVRGILDGHIVMERAIAERGRYPAINILKSVSRTMPDCNNDQENALVQRARMLLASYENMAELIRLGAYRKGTDPSVDEAIDYNAPLETFLKQKPEQHATLQESYSELASILGMDYAANS